MPHRSVSYQAAPVHLMLDQRFYRRVTAATFPNHLLRFRNDRVAANIGLDALDDQAWIEHFGKFNALPDNIETPLALCYHGHQFGHYNPNLSGRGFLAQMLSGDGRILDLGTKGSGQTPFSRTADGRLTLKGAVREILATEMLDALGVNTSKTLSVIETGEELQRNDEPSPTRSAVLVRLSHSHIRVGSFQRLSFLNDLEGLEMLIRHTARYYFADQLQADDDLEVLAPTLLRAAASAVAVTAGAWLAAGFVHGVLNTDNFNVTGESFDYGPWRFLFHFDPGFTAAYFDQTGRYAYGRQADACMWAMCRLADCFMAFATTDAKRSCMISTRKWKPPSRLVWPGGLGWCQRRILSLVRNYAASFSMRRAPRRPGLTSFCMISGEAGSGAVTIRPMPSPGLPTACPALRRLAMPTTPFSPVRQQCR